MSSAPAPNTTMMGRFNKPRLRIIIFAVLAALLIWQVVTRSVAAYLAETNPEAALQLRPTEPTALLNLAGDRLSASEVTRPIEPVLEGTESGATPPLDISDFNDEVASSDEAAAGANEGARKRATLEIDSGPRGSAVQIETLAKRALRYDPLSARAFRILGQLAHAAQNQKQTDAFMEAAAKRSHHESLAVYWTMRKNYLEGDYRAALRNADVLLRTRNDVIEHIMPMLGRIAETGEASVDLKRLLANNPPWRPQFFAYLPKNITDARTPLDIFLGLVESSDPPTTADLRSYLQFLIQHGFTDLAYYAWLQFLPSEQLAKAGRLFNGSFETPTSGLPFDWVFSQSRGVTIQFTAPPDQPQTKALLVEFGPGRVEFRGISQLVLLPPGTYSFSGKSRVDLSSQRGLQWQIACSDKKQLGETFPVIGHVPEWKDFTFSFTVPEAGCPSQTVELVLDARSESEMFVSGSTWFDDLRITRDPAPGQKTGDPDANETGSTNANETTGVNTGETVQ